jgi:hypothetical protein
MMTDPVFVEVRKNREAFAAKYNNDLEQIYRTLKDIEATSGRTYVKRVPKLIGQELTQF